MMSGITIASSNSRTDGTDDGIYRFPNNNEFDTTVTSNESMLKEEIEGCLDDFPFDAYEKSIHKVNKINHNMVSRKTVKRLFSKCKKPHMNRRIIR